MRHLQIALMAGVFSLLSSSSYAQDCFALSEEIDFRECMGNRYISSDKQLNKVYKQLMAKSDVQHKKFLKIAQLSWLKYRDTHCEYEAMGYEGGTGYGAYHNNCLTNLTMERTELLQRILKGPS